MTNNSAQIAPIQLPDTEWIPHMTVWHRIQQSFSIYYREAKGIRVLTNKLQKVGDTAFPFRLTSEDYRRLEQNSLELPELTLSMSEEKWDRFMLAYEKLSPPPLGAFTPLRPSEASVYATWVAAGATSDGHRVRLNEKVKAKEIVAINSASAPVSEISFDARLRRSDLEAYFIEFGLQYAIESHFHVPEEPDPLRNISPFEWDETLPKVDQPRKLQRIWTYAELKEVAKDVADPHLTWDAIVKKYKVSRQFLQRKLKHERLRSTKTT